MALVCFKINTILVRTLILVCCYLKFFLYTKYNINLMETIMNKDDFKLAYDDLFKNSSFKLIDIQKHNKNFYNFIGGDGNTRAILSLTDPEHHPKVINGSSLVHSEYLNANSILFFEKAKREQVEKLFETLNYEYLNNVISACYAMGQDFGFYENMSMLKAFSLADCFSFSKNKTTPRSKVVLTNIGEIHFQPVVVEQNTDNLKWIRKKSICAYVRFKIVNNELHPFVLLTVPYAPRKNITFDLDLHPLSKDESIEAFNLVVNTFESTLSNYMNTLLKRHLKMKVKELELLSIEDKKNYLIVAHMNKV